MGAMSLEAFNRMLWSFAGQRVITTAARAGILRRLAEGPATVDQAAEEIGLDELATGKVMRALTALELVEADGERYRMVESLARHFRGGADDITPMLNHLHEMYDSWGANLEPWLKGGEWETRKRDDDEVAAFGFAMQAIGSFVAKKVARALELSGSARMLDVGGGFGQYACELCRVNPELRATVLDIPSVAEMATRKAADGEFADRVEWLAGDYLEADYGSGYDLVLFANVLHQENIDSAADMVRRGAGALAPGGRVAVVDFAIDDDQRENLQGCLFAINMRSFGDTYTEPTIRGWMEAAGLIDVERIDIDPVRWMIVGRKG
jgi:SAM-dependent methyltransferase